MHGYSGTGGRLGASEVPLDYAGLLLDEVELDTQGADAKRNIEGYHASFDKQFADVQLALRAEGKSSDQIRIKSLYLWSESPGTGKTTVAAALLQEYLLRNFLGNIRRGKTPPLRPVYFLDVNAWQTEYNTFNRPRVPESVAQAAAAKYYAAMDKAKAAPFTVLDDIGVRASTDGFRGDLHDVINHRVANELPTIYTSNIPISELESIFGEKRLADRIRHMTKEIHFEGTSKRGMRK
jgi:DNA replication protein DnaC